MSWIEQRNDGVVVLISVRPRASRSAVTGISGGRLRVEVNSAPQDGEATRQALETLAKAVGAKVSDATLLQGATNRHKVVFIAGVQVDECKKRLGID